MKIFYAIQATGNGHIARAIELIPYLEKYGKVDVFLSGSNSTLATTNILPVKYRSKGISLQYGNHGGLNYWNTLKQFAPLRVYKEAQQLPVEKYDIVINDFESITSLACRMKKISSVNFGHQASFQSDKVPRPGKKSIAGELVLKHYAPAACYVGLHFKQYDDFILPPVIKKDILEAEDVFDKGHVAVYLPHFSDLQLVKRLKQLKDIKFEVFSKRVTRTEVNKNVTFVPIDNKAFSASVRHAAGVITGAGFETPSETLYLGKKLMVVPIHGQYEQLCNAEALKHFDVPVLEDLDHNFTGITTQWLSGKGQKKLDLPYSTGHIISRVINTALSAKENGNFIPTYSNINPSLAINTSSL